jgi:diguanylate cyclase (GGDEF)-like protein
MNPQDREEHQPTRISGYPVVLFGYIVAVVAIALPIVAAAAVGAALASPGLNTLVGVVVFFVLALLAEMKPVPLDEEERHVVSLAFIFVSSSGILFGWHFSVLIGATAILAAQIHARTPFLRMLFNTGVYSVAAFAASLPSFTGFKGSYSPAAPRFESLTALSFLQGAIFVTFNVSLVCVAVGLFVGSPIRSVLREHLRHSLPAFVVMGFLAALAVALWAIEPPLLVLLAGPLFTLSLYQRYALRTKVALRAAATDSLTGLGNHRSFEARIVEVAERAAEAGSAFTLCLIDVDDFKRINDRYGHPEGDQALVDFARLLETSGANLSAYRLGGDEFALIVEGGEQDAIAAVESLRSNLPSKLLPQGEQVTFCAGISSFPDSAADVAELQRTADVALYWTKRHGKNRWCAYSPSVVEVSWTEELAATAEYDARLRAAENLIKVVDARDTYTGSHSESVSALVEVIGETMGLPEQAVRQLRLAGLLHDLGKIAVPDPILQKPGRLTPAEIECLRRHPKTGFDLLEGLEVHPVDLWILHHHEHWDGSGYPHGLAGEEIPIGSRIILVADAFDAMTSERSYRAAIGVDAAIAELHRYSGSQFDPTVVSALERALHRSWPLVTAGAA